MLIFVSIFLVGFAMLVLSMIFGHDAGDAFDHDLGGDMDHAGHGPSIFSMRMISLLLVGFGAGSFGVRATSGASMLWSSMAGVGGALFVGVIGYFIIRMFYASQASSTITNEDIIGCTGNLIDAIAENGNGQVSCILRGREITYLARAKDGGSLARGTPVRVVSKTGNTVTVETLE